MEIFLTLEDAINRAIANSISLQKNVIELELAQYSAEHIWSVLFPSFSLGAELIFLPRTNLISSPGFNYNANGIPYSVNFGIDIQLNTTIPSSMRETELAYRMGLLSYENASRRVALEATKTFYSLLANKVNIANLEEALALAERQLENNRIARANGLIGELPWLRSSLSAETARYNLSVAQASFDNSLKEFLTTLGLDRNTEVILVGTINPVQVNVDAEALILEFLPRRPDIISQRQIIEQAVLRRTQRIISTKAPSLSFRVGWTGSLTNTGFTDNLSGSLSLTIPIDPWIPGTQSNQALRATDADLEKARLELLNTENAARANIRSLSENINNAWESIEMASLILEIAQRTYELTEAGLRSGSVEYLSFENTRKDLADAQYRLLQSELNYLNLLLDLASSLNVDLETLIRRGE
ncbi:MAG: TolC family protein [Treponema sp.]|nr:TolC family protein [Treponema sp.]